MIIFLAIVAIAIPTTVYANSLRKVETNNKIAENIYNALKDKKLPPFSHGEYPTPTQPVKTPPRASTQVSKPITAPVATQSDQWYKLYIYNHESGNNPARWNTSGCLGLGQACPASKLLSVCPTMDYACEDAWFTRYAISRYGSWYNAYKFWLANHWW